jgi:putative endopeptidase
MSPLRLLLACVIVCTALDAFAADGAAPPANARSGLDAEYFDRSARPQDDLYQHVNGGWLAATKIPPDRGS